MKDASLRVQDLRWSSLFLALILACCCTARLRAADAIEFQATGAIMSEVGATNAVLGVARFGSLVGTASVDYATSNGTAVAGQDFVGQAGTLVFNPGEEFKTITIAALDDTLAEGDEWFTVVLSNPIGAQLGHDAVTSLTISVLITDNECLANLVDAGFDPRQGPSVSPSGPPSVYAMALQPDGKVVVSGFFTAWSLIPRPSLARLNSDGSLDGSFNPVLGGVYRVNAVQIQSDGKILIAGLFSSAGGIGHTNIARLNPDGSVDGSFAGNLADDSWPDALAIQPDGKILVGGGYGAFDGIPPFIVRLNTNGAVDSSFVPPPFGDPEAIRSLALQLDGKILLGGSFGVTDFQASESVRRLNANGSRDLGFAPPLSLGLQHGASVAVQPDGKILVGGITRYDSSNSPIARLNPDGSIDPGFEAHIPNNNSYSTVQGLALQPDGKIVIGGSFVSIEGYMRNGIGRLNPGGSLDLSFDPGLGIQGTYPIAYTVAVQPDSRVLLAGSFSSVNGFPRLDIARLLPDNEVSTIEFSMAQFSTDEAVAAGILVRRCGDSGGAVSVDYSIIDGTASNGLDFVAPDGTVFFTPGEVEKTISIPIIEDDLIEPDENFLIQLSHPTGGAVLGPQFSAVVTIRDNDHAPSNLDRSYAQPEYGNSFVEAMVLQPDGKLVIAGDLHFIDGVPRQGIARLNADGTLDPGFDPGTNVYSSEENPVTALALQADGEVLFGAAFPSGNGLARLYSDGSLDTNFAPNLSVGVKAIVVLASGDMLVGGGSSYGIVRLNAEGARDTNFVGSLGDDPSVESIILDQHGRIVVGGQFGEADGQPRSNLARMESDGTLDPGFAPQISGGDSAEVFAIQVQGDGRIVIAGLFDAVNGVPRHNIARLHENGSLDLSFDPGTGTDGPIHALLIQPDGRIVLAGYFLHVNGVRSLALARLNADGSFDISFAPQAAPEMNCTSLLTAPDGKLLVGGIFCRQGPGDDIDEYEYCYGVIRLNPDPLPALHPPQPLLAGAVQLNASVLPGRTYVLQASADLMNWAPLNTNSIRTSSTTIQFIDPAASIYRQRFYRMIEQP